MAFTLQKLEPVQFGDITEVPQITSELRLRLDILKISSAAELDAAIETLASAFPVHKAAVIEYLKSPSLPALELSRLRAYLTGGENAVKALDSSFGIAIDKAIDRHV